MSDKSQGLGLFVNKRSGSNGSSAAAVSAGGKQKDVKKRWVYVGVGAIGVVVAATTIFSDKKPERVRVEKEAAMVNVTPPNADKQAFEARFGKDLEALKNQVETLKSENAALAKKQEELKTAAKNAPAAQPPAGIVPPPSANGGGLSSLGGMPEAPPPPPAVPGRSMPAPGGAVAPSLPPPVSSAPVVFDLKPGGDGTDPSLPTVNAKVSYQKNASAGMLPAGSFAPVVLLNGLDAGTSAATQSNPMPVLMNVTDQATLPGSAKYRLKSCFLLANGYGDLSAERVYVRFNRLSCVDKNDRLILSQEVAGYVVDSDGKLGLRGKVVDRQGARLGKAVVAGFAQGLSGALGQAQGTVTSNLSTGSTMNSISGNAALRASGLSGAQTAAQQIAEFYLREAQSIFPVVSIDTGRTATAVFTNSVSLTWTTGDSQFVKNVTPNN